MALDHALALNLPPGRGVIRMYGWRSPTISLGRNEPAAGLYDLARAERRGIGFVRRPTGGRAVLHDEELTYAIAMPARAFGGLRRIYERVNGGILLALRRIGARAELAAGAGGSPAPSAGPCFGVAAEGEVTVDGGKLVGSAQARIGRTILQHGSLLLRGSQEALTELRITPAQAGCGGNISLESALGSLPPFAELRRAVIGGLLEALGGRYHRDDFARREWAEADRLGAWYRSPEWTWRR